MLEKLQLYRTARLVLNTEEGMTDKDDAEHLEWLLGRFVLLTRLDLNKALLGNWDPEEIDMLIRNAEED